MYQRSVTAISAVVAVTDRNGRHDNGLLHARNLRVCGVRRAIEHAELAILGREGPTEACGALPGRVSAFISRSFLPRKSAK